MPEFEEAGYSPSYEHRLPVVEMTEEELRPLGPWLGAIARLEPAAARGSLRSRWAGRTTAAVQEIVDVLMEYAPTSIVTRENRAWLLCVCSEGCESSSGFLLPAPVDAAQIKQRLTQYGLHDPMIADFVTALSGLREDFEPSGRGFIRHDEEWHTFDDPSWSSNVTNYDEWRGSLQIFGAMNGNALLLHQDGKVGWLTGDTRVHRFASTFAEFCAKYAQYRRQIGSGVRNRHRIWTFDSSWSLKS